MTPRANRLFADWHPGQGSKIKAARPMAVYAQCLMLAKDLAARADEHVGRVLLLTEQIGQCEQRALSSARVAQFGAVPRTEDQWHHQIAAIKAAWAAGEDPGRANIQAELERKPFEPDSTGSAKRVAELAAANREGRSAAEMRDIPEASTA